MLSPKIHRYIFLFGVCGLAFGMMIGTVPTSVPQFILLGNWLLEANFKGKWDQIKSNKLFWIISAAFLVHVLGLLHTSDLNAGWDDVRTKMPLMFLPLIFFTTAPLKRNEFFIALYCFIGGCVVNVAWCYIYSFVLHKNEVVRSASRFMSHIRLGLYLNMAIAASAYFIYNSEKFLTKLSFSALLSFFISGMYALGLFSGMINFLVLLFIFVLWLIFRSRLPVKITLLTVFIASLYFIITFVKKEYDSQVIIKDTTYNVFQEKSINGRAYVHIDSLGHQKENGNIVMINVQWEELKNEWNRRCPEDTFSYHPPHNLNRYEILLRYLSSKELSKDSLGIASLNNNDIENIKRGITNFKIPEWSYLRLRLYESINEYEEQKGDKDINGHSLTMRPYFWKAAFHIIKQNLLFGIGTGDVQQEMNAAYRETRSPLSEEWYKRPHNQFITVTVATGLIGLIIFIISLFYPLFYFGKRLHVLYSVFFLLALLSFTVEDTLESQAGLTFFAFFNSLLIAESWYRMPGAETSGMSERI